MIIIKLTKEAKNIDTIMEYIAWLESYPATEWHIHDVEIFIEDPEVATMFRLKFGL